MPGGPPGLQNRWARAAPPAGSIPVRPRHPINAVREQVRVVTLGRHSHNRSAPGWHEVGTPWHESGDRGRRGLTEFLSIDLLDVLEFRSTRRDHPLLAAVEVIKRHAKSGS